MYQAVAPAINDAVPTQYVAVFAALAKETLRLL